MGKLNVVIGYSCRTREVLRGCVFGYGVDWKSDAVSRLFYGTVAIVSSYMADGKGSYLAKPSSDCAALPGLLAYCPSVIPIEGSWLIGHVAERISGDGCDIEATVFADADTYRSVLDCGSIAHVYVVTRDDDYVDWMDRKFEYRGWETCKMEFDDPQPGVHIIEYRRDGGLDIAEKDLMSEIDRMEDEMNDTSVEEMDEGDREKLDSLFRILEASWKLYGKFGKDMTKYLAGSTFAMEEGEIGGEDLLDEARPAELPDGVGEELSRMSGDAMDSPASLRLVSMLANQLAETANVALAAKQEAAELRKKLESLDLAMAGAVRDMESGVAAVRDSGNEAVAGLRRQLGMVIAIQRAKQWGPLAAALLCLGCCIGMILT
jgi:hypothetical protein